MSRPADGLRVAVAACFGPDDVSDDAVRAAADWLADHLDALAETGKVDHGSFRLAAAEVRAAGGVG